jgi:hypothetical protein
MAIICRCLPLSFLDNGDWLPPASIASTSNPLPGSEAGSGLKLSKIRAEMRADMVADYDEEPAGVKEKNSYE